MEENHEEGVSRRKVLKRMGAGVAVAWTAPVLTSLGSPAFAQSPSCVPVDCINPEPCGGAGCPQPDPCPFCTQLIDNSCICWTNGACFGPAEQICQSDADCEANGFPGYRCGRTDPNCTCLGETACFLPCGSSGSARPRKPVKRLGRS